MPQIQGTGPAWPLVISSKFVQPVTAVIGAFYSQAALASSYPLTLDWGAQTFPNTTGITLTYSLGFCGGVKPSQGSATGLASMPSTFSLFNFGGYLVYVLGGRVYAESPTGLRRSFLPQDTTQNALPLLRNGYVTATLSATTGLTLYVGPTPLVTFPDIVWVPGFLSASTQMWGFNTELTSTSTCTLVVWDVQLYDYALTPTQVASLAQGGSC